MQKDARCYMCLFNKITIIIICAMFSNIAMAEDWRIYDTYGTNESRGASYFDKDSIKRTSKKVTVWIQNFLPDKIKYELKEQANISDADHDKRLVEFECKRGMSRFLSIEYYNKDGENIKHIETMEWVPLIPGTISKKLYDILCSSSPKLNYIINLGDEIKKIIPQCSKIQKKSGMIGLTEFSKAKYRELKNIPTIKNIEKCVAIDIYSNMLDSEFAKIMGNSKSVTIEYFSVENFHNRIIPYLTSIGMTLYESNDFMNLWAAAVDREIGKIFEKEIYQ